jgi:hypothetical protein
MKTLHPSLSQTEKHSILGWLRVLPAILLFLLFSTSTFAATTLTVTPITWNVIGLDSNNVNVGPNRFPVGARVCNTGSAAASNVTATLVWDSSNSYINIRPGTSNSRNYSPCHCEEAFCADEAISTLQIWGLLRGKRSQ